MKTILNETQLRQIVLESVKKVLKEASFEHGVDYNDADTEVEGEVRGKNWFANHGIINLDSNNESPVKVYVTTTFLGNHRLAGKLGAKWATASRKSMFNAYTVDSNSMLVVVNDTRSGKVYQIQYDQNGPVRAADANDTQIKVKKDWFFNKTVMNFFRDLLNKTYQMCTDEDEFFDSKTSKTYARYSGKEESRYNDMAARNQKLGKPTDAGYGN